MKVDWSKVPPGYDWVTSDRSGTWAHRVTPRWDDTFERFVSDRDALLISSKWIGNIEPRPTEGDTNAD